VNDQNSLVGLPPELADVFARTDGAWKQWTAQTDEVRHVYTQWVTAPRHKRTRRKRASWTADYAARGVLVISIQRPRDREISRDILGAVLIWLAVTLVLGGGELLTDEMLNGHPAWASLEVHELTFTALVPGPALTAGWRSRRRPVARGPQPSRSSRQRRDLDGAGKGKKARGAGDPR